MKPLDKLALAQIERRLESLRKVSQLTSIKPGWINFMRTAFGLSLAKLAKKAKVSAATMQHTERRESEGRVTLETMHKIANAMDCKFIYAFVPENKIDKILWDQARKKAALLIKEANVHMVLEDQQVSEGFKIRVEQLADSLLKKGDIW